MDQLAGELTEHILVYTIEVARLSASIAGAARQLGLRERYAKKVFPASMFDFVI
jgi:hypothetical protein